MKHGQGIGLAMTRTTATGANDEEAFLLIIFINNEKITYTIRHKDTVPPPYPQN